MANPRHDDRSAHSARETVRQIGERTADETRRVGESAVDAGQDLARVGADVMQRNAEIFQNTLRFGLETVAAVMGRSSDQLSRTLGLSGDEVHEATERSTRSAASILHSTSAAAQGVSGMSQEYFAFIRQQIETSIDQMNKFSRCRTPQDLAAVQTEFVQQMLESAIQSGRRIADLSLKVADDAARQMSSSEKRAA
jgi:phasin family protein